VYTDVDAGLGPSPAAQKFDTPGHRAFSEHSIDSAELNDSFTDQKSDVYLNLSEVYT
jgi:hypothetical protein